ncbi:MAG TPA: alkaline phosphatase D family protein, partial [Chitinophagales bacterium]|nr:alkaline phosphatase D family protein [Chitinophagales bacterium]
QVMIAPLIVNNSVFNGDQWDGYPAERRRVFDYIMQNNIHDVVFLNGDIHSSWADDLPHPDSSYNSTTHAGSVATEFIGSSITSTATGLNVVQGLLQLADPYYRYVESTKRGYLLFDVNRQRAQGDFIHISTTASQTYTVSDDAQWMNLDGNRFLSVAPSPLGPRTGNPPLVVQPQNTTAINNNEDDKMVILTCYPNPSANEVAVQYYLNQPARVDLNIYNMNGQTVYHNTEQQNQTGLFSTKIYTDNLPSGTYLLSIYDGSKAYTKQLVKVK